MKTFKITLLLFSILINIPTYAADGNTECDKIKGKKAKIGKIYYGKPSPLGFSVMVNTLSDDGSTSDNSSNINFSKKTKSKGGAASIVLLTSAIDNNYVFVVESCDKGSVSAFHIETNSFIIKR
ncbi:hypothetical protein ACQPT2_20990 [Erwinia amylovora]